ncbi:hypothetical protein ACFUIZ_18910 [Streptomyces cinereoruber]|uniref:hypothetical protein n=1 Tax=Streptomyces cinereoruber TaxID=67260 RepID=UPI00363F5A1A
MPTPAHPQRVRLHGGRNIHAARPGRMGRVTPCGYPVGRLDHWLPAAAANALADLLHTEANRLGATTHPHWKDTAAYRALAVARALNGDR